MRILIIDDEFVALTKMTTMLKRYGRCDAATSGAHAVKLYEGALVEGDPYALASIDIELPDINGIELLRRFHEIEVRRKSVGAKKIMVTAESTPFNVQQSMRLHCDGFLVKPVKRDVLDQKLAALGLSSPKAQTAGAEATDEPD